MHRHTMKTQHGVAAGSTARRRQHGSPPAPQVTAGEGVRARIPRMGPFPNIAPGLTYPARTAARWAGELTVLPLGSTTLFPLEDVGILLKVCCNHGSSRATSTDTAERTSSYVQLLHRFPADLCTLVCSWAVDAWFGGWWFPPAQSILRIETGDERLMRLLDRDWWVSYGPRQMVVRCAEVASSDRSKHGSLGRRLLLSRIGIIGANVMRARPVK
ncbi:MAG: hypothetical protein QOJ25_939 [Solirubrobacteraceae bacterium]|nr:hypothetical protein [Solirubrobacteraceae bacterium]